MSFHKQVHLYTCHSTNKYIYTNVIPQTNTSALAIITTSGKTHENKVVRLNVGVFHHKLTMQ